MNSHQKLAKAFQGKHLFALFFSGMLFMALMQTMPAAAQHDEAIPADKEQQQRLDAMKAKSVDASVTILPAGLAGNPEQRLSELIGVLLEKQGLRNIELGKTAYKPSPGLHLPELSVSVGQFVKSTEIKTDYVLYAEMNVDTLNRRFSEVRAVVVDRSGALVWMESQDSASLQFRQVDDPDPMGYSMLLVNRLSPAFGLNEETARNAMPGRMAAIMNERSGLPPENEMAAMPERQKFLKDNIRKSSLVIYPLRVDRQQNAEGASQLVKMINDAGLCSASASKEPLLLNSSTEGPNEMKKLWDLARDFRDVVRKSRPDADYMLYADYLLTGYVHFVLCDRSGEWVIADLQNSTRPDFRIFDVSKVDGCNRMVLTRLLRYSKYSVADALRETIEKSGGEAAVSEFKKLRDKDGYYLSEEEMNALGYEYLFANRLKEAITIFRLNTEAFPDSWNTWDSLGEACAAAGDKEAAIGNYEKSLKLNPESPTGQEALKRLKGK